jgi:hypothetical protein
MKLTILLELKYSRLLGLGVVILASSHSRVTDKYSRLLGLGVVGLGNSHSRVTNKYSRLLGLGVVILRRAMENSCEKRGKMSMQGKFKKQQPFS